MEKTASTNKFFTRQLLKWNELCNTRQMPWKGEKDAYRIWLSEIILQQTRVEQGLAYYQRFIKAFPTVNDLAKAPETTVFKLWEGLGYYSRCKNLIATARFISTELNGEFPNTYEAILKLKGIGPYTAAAISSFAFQLPHAVVDGNVFRVLSRFFGIKIPIDSTEGKKTFTVLANSLLDKKQPGIYNQALMDFGAVICKPQQPLCDACLLQKNCVAYLNNKVNVLPVKEKKIIKRTRWFYYFIVEHNNSFLVRKRPAKDIWENLYEFVLFESDSELPENKIKKQLELIAGIKTQSKITISKKYKQQLSHQTIHGQFIKAITNSPLKIDGYDIVSQKKILLLPFPKFITSYLKDIE
ncbi:A/G-specific adenine glycosylase [Ferruginibacter albus]|uniref:A/G-specific adenine glycosylase n=1 Tax=Ferruginibacter albus TaxID=2875540 RepID=UPI001CC81E31|nr:A/G-specific adenine glycosylase [Ferruginibacter albus]UAY51770.1 A/G-specific adenine glycosylase [Ferruginibacter albus]